MPKNIYIKTTVTILIFGLGFQICNGDYRTEPDENVNQAQKVELSSSEKSTPGSQFQVSGWLPTSWDIENATQSWEANYQLLNEINPIWYKMCVNDQNEIISNHGAESKTWIEKFRQTKMRLAPMISNASNNTCLSRILKSEEERSKHISDIVNKVQEFNFDGIDVDYEKVKVEDRDLFSIFIEQLASQLHSKKKILSIAVHPQKSGKENWNGPGGQDWSRLGKVADEFKIMAYDHHWLSGSPGSIAPKPWLLDILDFAVKVVPIKKIQLGVPFYAYDWPIDAEGNRIHGASSRTFRTINEELCQKYECSRQWIVEDATPMIRYFSAYDNQFHAIYYENARSLSNRLDLVREYEIGGIAIWRMGSEDPSNWRIINEKLRGQYIKSFSDCNAIFDEYINSIYSNAETNKDQSLLAQSCHAANRLYELKILNGDGQGNFIPDVPLSRAQLLKIAFVAHKVDANAIPSDITNDFRDVQADDWFATLVTKAKYSGWINGYPDNTFRPNAQITRAEAIKIFLEIGSIQVAKTESWSQGYWTKGKELGLTNPDWQENENAFMTRGEAALILARFLEVE
ncbi:MAG: glycosyl hydrolase family 18 protein [Patescibacteria group bacterium]|nr:glycosyl hydrolase family 18 protein [Patescibacteria group bacterium]